MTFERLDILCFLAAISESSVSLSKFAKLNSSPETSSSPFPLSNVKLSSLGVV